MKCESENKVRLTDMWEDNITRQTMYVTTESDLPSLVVGSGTKCV